MPKSVSIRPLWRERALRVARILTLIWVSLFALLLVRPVCAQTNTEKAPPRKLIHKVDPPYPWDLKRAYIGGTVRLDVMVTPRGNVESVSVVGGNPILADVAARTVKKWQYAPADAATKLRVNVEFDPRQ
ncbi:MAG TPA: energy transducer TonB [Acidobacteriota bacterium]